MSKFNTIAIIGFSGTGKTTISKDLVLYDKSNYHRVVTSTTRDMRIGEVEGVDYFFDTKENFKDRVKKGEFIEHASFGGNFYGTPTSSFNEKKINLVVCEPSGVMSLYNNPKIKLLHIVNINRDFSLILNSIDDEKRVRQITNRRANKEEEKELDKIPAAIKNQIIDFENNFADVRVATLSFNKIFNMNSVVSLYDYDIPSFLKEHLTALKKNLNKTKNQALNFILEHILKEGQELIISYSDDLRKSNDVKYMSQVNSFMDNLDVLKAFYNNKNKASNQLVRNTLMEIYNRASILKRFDAVSLFYSESNHKWREDKKLIFKKLSNDIIDIKNSNGFIDKKSFKSIEASLDLLKNYKQIVEKKMTNKIVLNSSFIIDYAICQYDKYKKNHLRLILDEKKMDYLHNDAIYKLFLNNGKKETLNVLINSSDGFVIYHDNKILTAFELDENRLKYINMSEDEIIETIRSNKEDINSIPYLKQTTSLYTKLLNEGLIDSDFKSDLYIKSEKVRNEFQSVQNEQSVDIDSNIGLNK